MSSETPLGTGAATPPAVSTAGERGSIPVLPAEFDRPGLTTSTVIFPPHRPVFYEQDDVDAATEAANQTIGEHLALLGICWGDDDA